MRSDMSCSRMASKLCGCNGSWSLVLLDAQPGHRRDWAICMGIGVTLVDLESLDMGICGAMWVSQFWTMVFIYVFMFVMSCSIMLYIVVPYLGRFEQFEHLWTCQTSDISQGPCRPLWRSDSLQLEALTRGTSDSDAQRAACNAMCNASCCNDFASSPKMQLFYVAAPAVPC